MKDRILSVVMYIIIGAIVFGGIVGSTVNDKDEDHPSQNSPTPTEASQTGGCGDDPACILPEDGDFQETKIPIPTQSIPGYPVPTFSATAYPAPAYP